MAVSVRLGVFDENEVFRRGVVACLGDDDAVSIGAQGAAPLDAGAGLDVAVVSAAVAGSGGLTCPLVVCGDATGLDPERVWAVLPRTDLDAGQLTSAVRAVAAGLRVTGPATTPTTDGRARLDPRSRQVLGLLADGASTPEIAGALGYSVRTIKAVISGLLLELGCQNRAEAVALAVRRQLI